MHTFKINDLILFSTPSACTCFDPNWFILRKTHFYTHFCTVCFSCIYISSLSGRRVFSNTLFRLFDFKSVRLFCLRYLIVSQWTVLNTQNIRRVTRNGTRCLIFSYPSNLMCAMSRRYPQHPLLVHPQSTFFLLLVSLG